jgi:MATE family multidrug resistance protein
MSWKIVKVAVPTILGQVFALLVIASNTAFIGHLGDSAKLAGVGLGTLYVNIFCQSIILGLNGAVSTFVSQSYGAGNVRKCGIYLNRGRVVAIMAFIPIVMILLMCEKFFLAIGMDPQASHYAAIYVDLLIPAMFFHSQFDATR